MLIGQSCYGVIVTQALERERLELERQRLISVAALGYILAVLRNFWTWLWTSVSLGVAGFLCFEKEVSSSVSTEQEYSQPPQIGNAVHENLFPYHKSLWYVYTW